MDTRVHHRTYPQCQNRNHFHGGVDQGKQTKIIWRKLKQNHDRWSSTKQILPSLSIAETTFTEHPTPREQTERTELSEAECDIDTLKKLKLGLRSSLWSKPSETGQSSDYSIAV